MAFKFISIMSAAGTWLLPLMQMSNSAQTNQKSDIQITILLSQHVDLYVSINAVVAWEVSMYFSEGLSRLELYAARGESAGIVWLKWFHKLLMASGVSAQSHSGSPHLLRTKRGPVGVHTAELHSKDVGQGDGNRLPTARLSPVECTWHFVGVKIQCP